MNFLHEYSAGIFFCHISANQDYWNFQNLLNLMKNLLIKIIFTFAGRIDTWFNMSSHVTLIQFIWKRCMFEMLNWRDSSLQILLKSRRLLNGHSISVRNIIGDLMRNQISKIYWNLCWTSHFLRAIKTKQKSLW